MKADNYNRNYMLWATHFVNKGAGQGPDAGYTITNGTLTQANFTGAPGTVYGVYDQISRPGSSADAGFIDFDASWHASDALTLSTQIGTSTGHGKTPTQDVIEWNTGTGAGASWKLNGVDSASDWNLGGSTDASTPTSPGAGQAFNWIFGDQNIDVVDKENYAKIDGEYTLDGGLFNSFKFGVRHQEHDRSSSGVIGQGPSCIDAAGHIVGFNWAGNDAAHNYFCPVGTTSPYNPDAWPSGVQNYPDNFASGLGGVFPRNVWYYTPEQLASFNYLTNRSANGSREDWASEFSLNEKNDSGYVQGDFAGQGWGGNVGLRLVRTKEHIIANRPSNAVVTGSKTDSAFGVYLPVLTEHSYNDVLPSANFRLDITKDLIARFAASKTMTRPDYSALAGALTLSPPAVDFGVGTGTVSNPDLKPVRSNNFDTSVEWYFAKRSLLSASIFYMDLTSYIGLANVTNQYMTFSNTQPQGYLADYVTSTSVNMSAKVHGLELSYQQPFGENFGVDTNYTYVHAKDENDGPVVGASKNTYNISGYFENDMFNARLTYTWRSAFFTGLDRATTFTQDAVGNLSASLGYKINDNLALTFDARNLNNPKLKYYALSTDQPRSMYQNGRQYYLTLRAKM